MLAKGNKKGMIRFAVQPAGGAKAVLLAGSFNQWKPFAMTRQKNGSFAATVSLPAGTHEYKFVVDGRWISDPENDFYVSNPYGTVNSVAKVE